MEPDEELLLFILTMWQRVRSIRADLDTVDTLLERMKFELVRRLDKDALDRVNRRIQGDLSR